MPSVAVGYSFLQNLEYAARDCKLCNRCLGPQALPSREPGISCVTPTGFETLLSVDASKRARFEALYDDTVDRVMSFCLRHVGPDQAEDVVAETYLVAWRRLDDIGDHPLPWLLVTARNHLHSWRRRNLRRSALPERLARLTRLAADPAEVTAHRRADLLRGLAALSAKDREVLLLIAWDGLSHDEAARVLGCSPGSFRVRLHRARSRFAAATYEAADPVRKESDHVPR